MKQTAVHRRILVLILAAAAAIPAGSALAASRAGHSAHHQAHASGTHTCKNMHGSSYRGK